MLVLRFGLGAMIAAHGYPLLNGGSGTWASVGRSMAAVGITAAPALWGLLAVLSQTIGGLFLAIGVLVRPSVLFILLTVIVALCEKLRHIVTVSYDDYSSLLALAVVLLAILIAGSGRYALGRAIKPLDGKWYQ
jgi:putative oxidoreductase